MANKSKRILIFTTAYRPFIGGSEIAIEEIVKRLPNAFFDIVTPRFKKDLPSIESGENYSIHRVGSGWRGDKLFFPWAGFIYASKLFKKYRHDAIHAFQASYAGGAAWFFKIWNKKTPMILTIQEGKNLDSQNAFIKFTRGLVVKKADKITAISEYLKKYILKIKKNAAVEVIPNGVDVDLFSKLASYGEIASFKDELGIKPGERVVISVSRLVEKNGLEDLIRAVALLNQSKEGVYKLVLVGDGEDREKLVELSKELGQVENIVFTGQVEYADLPKYLMVSDVFVRPSHSEGLGNSFLEAMAASVPIIGTKIGGIPDFLIDRETGLFCKVGDPESIAEKVKEAFSDTKLRDSLKKKGLSLVKNRYDWDKVARRYKEIYFL